MESPYKIKVEPKAKDDLRKGALIIQMLLCLKLLRIFSSFILNNINNSFSLYKIHNFLRSEAVSLFLITNS